MNENIIRIIVELILVLAIIVGLLWKKVSSKKPDNPGEVNLEMIPGHSEECLRRGDEITKLIENHKFLAKSITRTDTNIANLWKYVKKNGTG